MSKISFVITYLKKLGTDFLGLEDVTEYFACSYQKYIPNVDILSRGTPKQIPYI